jgi:type IX secretion system substrate protein
MNLYNTPNLEYICADDTQLTQLEVVLQNYGYDNCVLNTYCSFNPGSDFYTITGDNHFDSFNDGCDSADMSYPNLKLQLSDGNVSGNLFPDASGHYEIGVIEGSHTITPILENPTYFSVSPTVTTVTFPTESSPFDQSFCISASGTFPDLEVMILPLDTAIAGFDAQYKIVLRNKGNQLQSGAVSMTFDDTVLDFTTASPAPDAQGTNTLTWNFANLQPFEAREIATGFNLNSPIEVPALQSGSLLYYTASIAASVTDAMPEDNTFTLVQPVVNSFDPNDITCLEGDTVPPSMAGKYVHYMVRFENTGTAAAHNIVVKTSIKTSKFLIASLMPVSGSHPFTTRVTNTNKVEFIFENIQLPFDDANNDGYIVFKIKIRPTLTVGTTFSNSANIYFDYNAPIITNTATTAIQVLGTDDFDFNNHFTLYPNPANDIVNIKSKDNTQINSLSVYNTLGQLVLTVTNPTESIDVSELALGNYVIKINTDKGISNTRFVKK